jgi:hypothetical protein
MADESFETTVKGLISSLLPEDDEPVETHVKCDSRWIAWPVNHQEMGVTADTEREALCQLLLNLVKS